MVELLGIVTLATTWLFTVWLYKKAKKIGDWIDIEERRLQENTERN